MTNHSTTSNTVPVEHERRFFPDPKMLPPDFHTYPKKIIEQGYLEDALRTRLRDEQNDSLYHTYFQTRKSGEGISKAEDEIEIPKSDFDSRWPSRTCDLLKTRYYYPLENGFVAEINVFHRALDTYIQIEVEFDTQEQAVTFVPPTWFGEDVTNDPRHGNYMLAKHGLALFLFSLNS